jgi:hypothetical protein
MNFAPAPIHCNFPLFNSLGSSWRLIQISSCALLFVEFNFVLNTWSAISCVICGPKNSSFPLLGLAYSGKILGSKVNPFTFFTPHIHRYFYPTDLDMQRR